MEFDENKEEKYTEDEYVDIYSKRAIFWFSVFSYIYAGVLLIINLRNAGYRRAILEVAGFLFVYYIAAAFIVKYSGIHINIDQIKSASTGITIPPEVLRSMLILSAMSIGINILGGLVLTQYFFRKYFPDNDYYPKPVLQPILILVLIYFLFRFLI